MLYYVESSKRELGNICLKKSCERVLKKLIVYSRIAKQKMEKKEFIVLRVKKLLNSPN